MLQFKSEHGETADYGTNLIINVVGLKSLAFTTDGADRHGESGVLRGNFDVRGTPEFGIVPVDFSSVKVSGSSIGNAPVVAFGGGVFLSVASVTANTDKGQKAILGKGTILDPLILPKGGIQHPPVEGDPYMQDLRIQDNSVITGAVDLEKTILKTGKTVSFFDPIEAKESVVVVGYKNDINSLKLDTIPAHLNAAKWYTGENIWSNLGYSSNYGNLEIISKIAGNSQDGKAKVLLYSFNEPKTAISNLNITGKGASFQGLDITNVSIEKAVVNGLSFEAGTKKYLDEKQLSSMNTFAEGKYDVNLAAVIKKLDNNNQVGGSDNTGADEPKKPKVGGDSRTRR